MGEKKQQRIKEIKGKVRYLLDRGSAQFELCKDGKEKYLEDRRKQISLRLPYHSHDEVMVKTKHPDGKLSIHDRDLASLVRKVINKKATRQEAQEYKRVNNHLSQVIETFEEDQLYRSYNRLKSIEGRLSRLAHNISDTTENMPLDVLDNSSLQEKLATLAEGELLPNPNMNKEGNLANLLKYIKHQFEKAIKEHE